MADGERRTAGGGRRTANGERRAADGERRAADGERGTSQQRGLEVGFGGHPAGGEMASESHPCAPSSRLVALRLAQDAAVRLLRALPKSV
ncbi:MAG: hypothetical protein D6705_17245, partial [Deltaproteobacteria bacterium]